MNRADRFVAVLAVLLLASSCARGKVNPVASSSPSNHPSPVASSPSQCQGSEGASEGRFQLTNVEVKGGMDDDVVTFSFQKAGGGPGKAPSYRVSPANPPFTKDPSDQPMAVTGAAFARIVFPNGSGVDLTGASPRETYTGSKDFRPHLSVIAELVEAGDFEGQSTWIAGLEHKSCWSVTSNKEAGTVSVSFPQKS